MRKFIFSVLICMIIFTTSCAAAEIKKGIENFPENYRGYLQILKNKHSSWEFSAFYTGLDFNEVIDNEYGNNRNLVPITYADTWKATEGRII